MHNRVEPFLHGQFEFLLIHKMVEPLLHGEFEFRPIGDWLSSIKKHILMGLTNRWFIIFNKNTYSNGFVDNGDKFISYQPQWLAYCLY